MATSTLMITAWLLAPLAASAAATEAASTLITATAGSSGSASAGDKVEVSATTRHVTALEDQRAQGDAVGDATNCADEACQRVPPER